MSMDSQDFLISNYRNLVKSAVQMFAQTNYGSTDGSKKIIWRHDCDFSLAKAVTIGAIDNEEGMKSTFFINIHADTYNALSLSGKQSIRILVEQGHEIGIHLDTSFYGGIKNEEQLIGILEAEIQLYRDHFTLSPEAFSFHNPTESEMKFENERYAGLVNCYSRYLRESWRYVSDSNGYWRHKQIKEVLNEDIQSSVQVLTHSEWWSEKPMMPRERLVSSLLLSLHEEILSYDRALLIFGRQNISSIEEKIRDLGTSDANLHLLLTAISSLVETDTSGLMEEHKYPYQDQMKSLMKTMASLNLISASLV